MKHEMTPKETAEELKLIRDSYFEEDGRCPLAIIWAIKHLEQMTSLSEEKEKK